MDLAGVNWSLITVIGPLLLAAVLLWAFLRNRSSRRDVDRSERGAREVYDESERVRRTGEEEK
ncbi:MAG: hypothetical protein JOZ90_06905 [Alphaproteobacteria bacterium]|nr:hypothetical protein [Alphaproteobacteria bacterium]MBV9370952.1 hypothetical protein [Alphaproteobacteria bacterium]MBV9900811.1 hypothetical protein [Alphaproteobacteria bacterium]